MSQERRKHRRVVRPIDGRWLGGGVGNTCRIGDLSVGGCFVQCLSTPRIGERTAVMFTENDGRALTLNGTVVHIEPRIGFSVEFHDVSADYITRLEAYLAYLHDA